MEVLRKATEPHELSVSTLWPRQHAVGRIAGVKPPLTYDQWLALTPEQRDWERATWNSNAGESIHIPEEALNRLRATSSLRIVGGTVGVFHMGEYILNPALAPEDVSKAPPFLTTEFDGFRVGFVAYDSQMDSRTQDALPEKPWWLYRVFDVVFGLTRSDPAPTTIHIVYCERRVVLTKRRYSHWRQVQDAYDDYKASLGPWTEQDLIEFFEDDFGSEPNWPFSRAQIAAFMASRDESLST